MIKTKKINIVGGGFAGLTAAALLGKYGHDVRLFEKNDQVGGRCRSYAQDGFVYDMGPSWYWMPDIFERYYQLFGHTTADFYKLLRLDPSYQVIFEDGDIVKLPANYEALRQLFESYEKGSADKLDRFLADARYKYEVGVGEFVHKPSLSIWEFVSLKVLKQAVGLNLFGSISAMIRRSFKNEKLVQLLEFPVLFLGAKPQNTPALYSLMNYADIKLGTWYPMGGMVEISKALGQIAHENDVDIRLNEEVTGFSFSGQSIEQVVTHKGMYASDYIIGAADYHHVETNLLPKQSQSYTRKYWETRDMAPSSLLFYVGVSKRLEGLLHHNLFFDTSFSEHSRTIYDQPEWPKDPLFYVCCPSKTDASVAPAGSENLFILVPLAAGLTDKPEEHDRLFTIIMARIHKRLGLDILPHIVYKKTFSIKDFEHDYHSFKGNAYGLANTLMQTAFLKPSMKSKKVRNLYFAGQLTTPGPGMPPSLISGEVVANTIQRNISKE